MSKILYEKLLASFNKANTLRKQKIVTDNGFDSTAEYKKFLQDKITGSVSNIIDVPTTSEIVELTDMVIAFDTTGSMGSYIQAVKTHVRELIPRLFSQNPNLKISVVAFGDYCDMASAKVFGKAYQVIDLTDNVNDLINFVNNAQNTSGGDSDEFYELVIKKITEETSWRNGSNKNVLFIGDCNPHPVGYSYSDKIQNAQINWRTEARKAATMNIVFDTLTCGNGNYTFYTDLAVMTGGIQLPFSSSSKTANMMEATALARGGKTTKEAFLSKSVSSEVTSDKEMTAVYSMYKTIVNK